jgi:predicted MFS family arabinose efflux permease
LSIAGFAATAVCFGPGRIGFGLFVPEFRAAFSMSSSLVGAVSSLVFLGFLIGLLMAQALLNRGGPKVPVLSGMVAATVGMAIVALSPTLPLLAIGVFLSGSSAGLVWTPFNDAVHRKIDEADRPDVLSWISTGTSLGIAAAGLAALCMVLTGLSWRASWAAFAVAGAAGLLTAWSAMRTVDRAADDGSGRTLREVSREKVIPLLAVAFVYGTTSAIFISFAADHLRSSGGVPGVPAASTPAFVFICLGVFGLAGLLTGQARAAIGLPRLLRLLLLTGAVSLVLVTMRTGGWVGLIGAAGLQGVHIMMTSAVLAIWSERLFPELPSRGFTAALLATAAGGVLGPSVAGVLSDLAGMKATFAGTAAISAAAAVLLRDHHVREHPA